MSRFDAVFLHNVLDYRTNRSHVPDVPDFKALLERLIWAENGVRRLEDGEDLASDIKGIASDYDFDSELSEYVDASGEAIQNLHDGVRGVYWKLHDQDFESLTRDKMIELLTTVHDDLVNIVPGCKKMGDMLSEMWVPWPLSRHLGSLSFLHSTWMSWTRDDHYQGYITGFKERGPLKVDMYARASVRMELEWTPSTLVFTSDKKIAMLQPGTDKRTFAMPLAEFSQFFTDWIRPTEEEIAMFDVVHPGADWQVLRYLRDYDEMLCTPREQPAPLIRQLVSVTTQL